MVRVGFSTTNKWLSRIVRYFTKSKVSHCFLVFMDDTLEREMILEADLKGIIMVPFDQFTRRNKIVAILDPKVDLKPGLLDLIDALGTNYDVGGLIGGAWVSIGRWFRQKWSNPFNNKNALFCSEAIVLALQAVNHPGSETLVPEDTTPQDLLDLLASQ